MKLVDANLILRYLVQDNPEQALAVKALLETPPAGQDPLFVPDVIVAEVIYVLTSPHLYALPRTEAADKLAAVITSPALQLSDKRVCLRALDLFGERPYLDFPDALLAAYAESEPGGVVYSFDHDFDRIEGITRVEPSMP